MNMYAFLSLLASYICFLFGVLIYQKDPKNELNKMFALLCISIGCISFGEFGARYADDVVAAFPWVKLGSIWPFTMALLLHFVFVFTKKAHIFRRNLTYVLLYTPACAFFLIDITTNLLSGELKKEYWGWSYSAPENLFVYISSIWAFSLAALSVIMCFLYFYRARDSERQCAKYVFIWVSIPVVAGIITEQILPLTSIKVPELGFTASALGVVFIQYAMVKYKLFALTPAVAAEDMIAAMSNFLFLTEEDGTISLVNQSALQLLGCNESELMGQPLKRVFAQKEWEKIEKKLCNLDEPYISEETHIVTKEKVIPVLLSISVVQDKEGNNLGMACVGSDLTDQKKAEEAQRRDVLLKEIHHRVKNNMQIISSLLSLQSRYFNDEQDKEMIKESQNRIKSMALVHEKLYQSNDLEHIDFCEYITDVVHRLVKPHRVNVTASVDVDAIAFGMDTALPCGLIINELVSNSLKHAFPDEKGEITVTLHAVDDTISLTVGDNGVGMPDTIDFRTAQTLGLRLVTILVEDQLNGTIDLVNHGGTTFCIQFRRTK